MAYYGFEHRYGSHALDERGNLIGKLVVFDSRNERNTWVRDGNPYLLQPGARSIISSKTAARFRRTIGAEVEKVS